jgi:hypothetical protein
MIIVAGTLSQACATKENSFTTSVYFERRLDRRGLPEYELEKGIDLDHDQGGPVYGAGSFGGIGKPVRLPF